MNIDKYRTTVRNGLITLVLLPSVVLAAPTLPKSGDAGFDLFTSWMQKFIAFMAGPYAIAVVVISAIIAVGAWMFTPKEPVMGWTVRIVTGALVLFNLTVFITGLQSSS